MILTLAGFVLAALWLLFPLQPGAPHLDNMTVLAMMLAGLGVLIPSFAMRILVLSRAFCLFPGLLSLDHIKKNRPLNGVHVTLILYSLFSLGWGIFVPSMPPVIQKLTVALWIAFTGFTFDLLRRFTNLLMPYLNSETMLSSLEEEGVAAIKAGNAVEILHHIDKFTEVGSKALLDDSLSLCKNSLDHLLAFNQDYFTHNRAKDPESVRYILFHFLSPVEMLFHKALDDQQEIIAEHALQTMGKIALNTANHNLPLATHPIVALGRMAHEAQDELLGDLGTKGSCFLFEIGRYILQETKLTQTSFRDPLVSVITFMHEISNTLFTQNKSLSPRLLKQPFNQLKELLKKKDTHPDYDAVNGALERVLQEFDALESILRTVPPPKKEETLKNDQ